jgi:hypothetical protein
MTLSELHQAVTKLKEHLDEVMSKTPGAFKDMPIGINIEVGEPVGDDLFLFNLTQNGCITHGIESLAFDKTLFLTLKTQEIK